MDSLSAEGDSSRTRRPPRRIKWIVGRETERGTARSIPSEMGIPLYPLRSVNILLAICEGAKALLARREYEYSVSTHWVDGLQEQLLLCRRCSSTITWLPLPVKPAPRTSWNRAQRTLSRSIERRQGNMKSPADGDLPQETLQILIGGNWVEDSRCLESCSRLQMRNMPIKTISADQTIQPAREKNTPNIVDGLWGASLAVFGLLWWFTKNRHARSFLALTKKLEIGACTMPTLRPYTSHIQKLGVILVQPVEELILRQQWSSIKLLVALGSEIRTCAHLFIPTSLVLHEPPRQAENREARPPQIVHDVGRVFLASGLRSEYSSPPRSVLAGPGCKLAKHRTRNPPRSVSLPEDRLLGGHDGVAGMKCDAMRGSGGFCLDG
ncbi:hypothetical protein BDN71DRAFT_1431180 [Pleurotus eryngii]|uniref:Uncharacterized protein n=1 Tax=Pleurotus eryngii TaxID=5323 RepID=A0A9P6D8I5_PLEER|nr:hypothetical protein BDN71DRAFT_1431180 [Pleurotus eryngii]